MRSYAGGFRFKRFISCCVCSCCVVAVVLIISKDFVPSQSVSLAVTMVCLWTIRKFAPVTMEKQIVDDAETVFFPVREIGLY
ncbi:MAG: accessory gene regulator B family protein [Hungatella sp.]|nr:accessory gene regulator B family protein [Hungatella sp.]